MRTVFFASVLAIFAFPANASESTEITTKTMKVEISDLQDSGTVLKQNASLSSNQDIKQTIEEQLRAIRDRDDRAAFELSTAKEVDDHYKPQDYMRDLRRQKPSLYNHVHYEILPASGSEKFQKVKLIDRRGKEALAMFKMEQAQNGDWRIGNIVILKTDQDPI